MSAGVFVVLALIIGFAAWCVIKLFETHTEIKWHQDYIKQFKQGRLEDEGN